MGNANSNRWEDHLKKETVEESLVLDINELKNRGMFDADENGTKLLLRAPELRNYSGVVECAYKMINEQMGLVLLRLTLPTVKFLKPKPTQIELVPVISKTDRKGSSRILFKCPMPTIDGHACERPVKKLYLPFGSKMFGCRKCHDLVYKSSQESRKQDDNDARAQELADRLKFDPVFLKNQRSLIGEEGMIKLLAVLYKEPEASIKEKYFF